MVLTIDVGSFSKDIHDSLIFHRLFAPSSPHTTTTNGRSCKSCHNNPVAIGYGKGILEFNTDNGRDRWEFDSFIRIIQMIVYQKMHGLVLWMIEKEK